MTEVRTDVPLDYHPAAVGSFAAALDIEGTVGPKALAAVREGLAVAYDVHAAINDTERELRAGTPHDAPVYSHNGNVRREHGAEEALAVAAEKATGRAVQTIERRIKEIQGYATNLRAAVDAAIDHPERKTPAGIAEAAEIRAHLKSLPDAERFPFIGAALSSLDTRTLAAVLHSPYYLSGLDKSTHETVRNLAERKFAPTESTLIDGMTKAVERMAKGAQSLQRRTAEVTAVAASRAAKRKAALERLASK